MAKSFFFLFKILLLFSTFGSGKGQFAKDPFSFVDSIFLSGVHQVQLKDIDYPVETKLLLAKMNQAILEDHEWFLEHTNKSLKNGGTLEYHDRINGLRPFCV